MRVAAVMTGFTAVSPALPYHVLTSTQQQEGSPSVRPGRGYRPSTAPGMAARQAARLDR
jgi:hypothetical protein